MRYFKYKISWDSETEGSHPFEYAASIGVESANAFAVGVEPDGDFYNYLLSGDFDDFAIEKWQIVEVSEAEILEAAHTIDDTATIVDEKVSFQKTQSIYPTK